MSAEAAAVNALERIADSLRQLEGNADFGANLDLSPLEDPIGQIADKLESIDGHLVEIVNTLPELVKAIKELRSQS